MTAVIVVIVLAVIVLVALGAWWYSRQHKTEVVREQFGSEYDRAVEQFGGDEQKATNALKDRQDRVEKVEIYPLSTEDRERYAEDWRSVQAQFVDDPGGAVNAADRLIADAMSRIGYPVDQFEQREEAVSVKYPEVTGDYRKAHEIAQRNEAGDANTEDLREAMVLYRGLFERLIGMPQASQAEATR